MGGQPFQRSSVPVSLFSLSFSLTLSIDRPPELLFRGILFPRSLHRLRYSCRPYYHFRMLFLRDSTGDFPSQRKEEPLVREVRDKQG